MVWAKYSFFKYLNPLGKAEEQLQDDSEDVFDSRHVQTLKHGPTGVGGHTVPFIWSPYFGLGIPQP